MKQIACVTVLAFGLIALAGGAATIGSAQEATPTLDPSEFSTEVTNPFFPLPVGTLRIYEGTETDPETGETHEFSVEERVLDDAYEVMGVSVVVLEVTEYEDGELIEVTRDYHAQHANGDVWYFGEHVDNYEDGELVDHDGTWIAGEGENKPSIFIPADPQVFDTILQEQAPGQAEDISTVAETGLSVTVAAGEFTDCIKTVDVNPLEVASEFKHYCPGPGLVREENANGVTELVSISETGEATPSA
jgi:hypothetical protein